MAFWVLNECIDWCVNPNLGTKDISLANSECQQHLLHKDMSKQLVDGDKKPYSLFI